ncbi:MAG: hypothetical protein ACXVB0_12815 [Mucilaginibacter sp.]
MSAKTLTRTELYLLVWEIPISKLAEQLKVKSTTLRKICIKEGIPLPPVGY